MNLETANDELIQQAAAGDAAAFEMLLAPYERQLYALCLRIAGNREDALDCVQETLLRIWRSLPKYRRQSALTTWFYRIAANTCFDLLRRQNTARRFPWKPWRTRASHLLRTSKATAIPK